MIERSKLKLGIGAPLSGNGAALGLEMARAAQLAIAEFNELVRALGVVIEPLTCDDGGTERDGERIAKSLAADPGVIGVVGHYNSNVTLKAAPIYDRAELPLIAPIVSNPRLTESGWRQVFRFTNRDDRTAAAISRYLVETLGKRNVATFETDTVYGRSMTAEFCKAFLSYDGQVAASHRITEGEKQFDALVHNLPPDIDCVFYGGTFEGAPLLKALRSHKLPYLFATGDGCWDIRNFLEPVGHAAETAEGVLVLSACPELGRVAGATEFAERYRQRFGDINNYAVNAFDATMTLLEAVQQVAASGKPGVTRNDVADALWQTQRKGIAYPRQVHWNDHGDNLAAITALHVIRNGRFVQVAELQEATQSTGVAAAAPANSASARRPR